MSAATISHSDVSIDYLYNKQASGGIANLLLNHDLDTGSLRPFIGDDGRSYVTLMKNGKPETLVTNNPASLRFQDWRLIDDAVIKVAKPRLGFIGELRSRGLEVSLGGGMGVTVFSYERMSDISAASISMDGRFKGESDRPVFDINNLPLPIISKDFSIPAREIMASRRGSTPLDVSGAELAAERVAEAAEQLSLGVWPSYTYGGGTVYGVTNFPQRITQSMTAPTAGGWTPHTTLNEVLAMRRLSQQAYHFGPWMIFTSTNWDQYLDDDFSSAKGDQTLRERLGRVNGVMGVQTLDFLQFLPNNPYTMLMVEMRPRTIREVIALDIVTMQWQSLDSMEINYKVMCIMVPQLRADMNSNTGIVHGSAASS